MKTRNKKDDSLNRELALSLAGHKAAVAHKAAVDYLLHTTGYLPPRNEKEMAAFEKYCSKVEIPDGSHININEIVRK